MRRKFTEAFTTNPKGINPSKSADIVTDIAKVYPRDGEITKILGSVEELIEKTLANLVPLIQELFDRIAAIKNKASPKSTLGKAITYALKNLPGVMSYAKCPELTLGNNRLENKIRPFALGRRNWLMANRPDGTEALATWCSLVATAQANGRVPSAELNHLFEGLRDRRAANTLLPIPRPAQ